MRFQILQKNSRCTIFDETDSALHVFILNLRLIEGEILIFCSFLSVHYLHPVVHEHNYTYGLNWPFFQHFQIWSSVYNYIHPDLKPPECFILIILEESFCSALLAFGYMVEIMSIVQFPKCSLFYPVVFVFYIPLNTAWCTDLGYFTASSPQRCNNNFSTNILILCQSNDSSVFLPICYNTRVLWVRDVPRPLLRGSLEPWIGLKLMYINVFLK